MDNESKKHKEFLKFFQKRNGKNQKAAMRAPASNRARQAGQGAPQRQGADVQRQNSDAQMRSANPQRRSADQLSRNTDPQMRNAARTSPQRGAYSGNDIPRRISRTGAADNAERQVNRPQPPRSRNPEANYRNTPRRTSAEKRRKQNIRMLSCAVLVVLLLTAAVILIVRSCTNAADVLRGTWDLDGITAYQFDGKGKGSLDLPDSSYAFTYEIKDGTLAIDFEDDAARDKTYTFTADKTKLTLTDNNSADAKTFELQNRKTENIINKSTVNSLSETVHGAFILL